MRVLLLLVGLGLLFLVLGGSPVDFSSKWKPRVSTRASRDMRSEVEALTTQMLLPLDKVPPATVAQGAAACERLKAVLRASPWDAEARRLASACELLRQLIAEREEYLRRALRGSQPTALDRVPGEWHVKGTGLKPEANKPINLAEYHHQMRAGFFAQTALRQWQVRSEEYRARIQPLLTPSRPQ